PSPDAATARSYSSESPSVPSRSPCCASGGDSPSASTPAQVARLGPCSSYWSNITREHIHNGGFAVLKSCARERNQQCSPSRRLRICNAKADVGAIWLRKRLC